MFQQKNVYIYSTCYQLTIYALIINLLIAHSHPVFLVILQNILRSYQGLHIIGKATTAAGLLQAASILKPDVIIADIALPGMEDFTPLQKLAVSGSQVKVLLSWRRHQQAVINEAMSAGCAGCIIHDATPAEYYLAIKQAVKGEVFYCSHTEKVINSNKNLHNAEDTSAEILSEKHTIMLYCMWLGYNSKEIAIAMGLSKETIDTYRKRLKKIIGSPSFSALEGFMKKNGII